METLRIPYSNTCSATLGYEIECISLLILQRIKKLLMKKNSKGMQRIVPGLALVGLGSHGSSALTTASNDETLRR
ncbi:hypothetical protein SLA2020_310330 [Shorea laevis]